MKYAFAFVVAWFLAVLNVSAMPFVEVLGVTPDFVLIFAVCWAVMWSEDEAIYVVPMAAILRDVMSSDPVGTSLIAFAPILFIAALARVQVLDSDFLPLLGAVAASSLCFEVLHALVLVVTGQGVGLWYLLFNVALPAAVVNSLFAPIIYLPVRWLRPQQTSVLRGAGRLTSPL